MARESHKASNRLCDAIAANKTKYMLLMHGRCPKGTEIRSRSECSAAAAYLNLSDTVVSSFSSRRIVSILPPPHCFDQGGSLTFNSASFFGSCSRTYRCLCKTQLPGVSRDFVGLCFPLAPEIYLIEHTNCPFDYSKAFEARPLPKGYGDKVYVGVQCCRGVNNAARHQR